MTGLLRWLFEDANISTFEAIGFYISLISLLFIGYSAKALWSFKEKMKRKMKIPSVISSLEIYQKEVRNLIMSR